MERWEPRPTPEVTPETAAYWEGCAGGELRLNHCHDCESVYHYPRAHCPECGGDDVGWMIAEGIGEIYSFAVMDRRENWPDGALPHVLAYVELTEGPTMVTNVVDCEHDELEIGTSVEVAFIPTERSDVAIPVFRPLER